MRHSKRRQETGKMLMDVVKYLLTAGFAGSLISESFNYKAAIVSIVGAISIYIIAFFTIPPEKKE
ncbi:hypothetical protein A45J_2703 [hot springs metagenome]|uniref:Uncharacterized protein n=1 Tax=hot springs metagenome TaxID=433727 RepID=A0A5J4L6G3_9ZZZZ